MTIESEDEDELGYVIKLVAKIKKDIADKEKLLSSVDSKTLLTREEDLGVAESGAVNATQGNIPDLGSNSSWPDNVPSKTDDERQNERSREEQDQLKMNVSDKEDITDKDKLLSSVDSKTLLKTEENLVVAESGAVNATQGNIGDVGSISSCSGNVPSKTNDERQSERSREEQVEPEMNVFDKTISEEIKKEAASQAIHSQAAISKRTEFKETTYASFKNENTPYILAAYCSLVRLWNKTWNIIWQLLSGRNRNKHCQRKTYQEDIVDKEKLLSSVDSKTLLTTEEDLGVAESGPVNATQGNIPDLGSTSSWSNSIPSKTDDERQNERSREEQDQLKMNVFDKNNMERSIQSKQKELNQAKMSAERCEVELENLKRLMDTIKAWEIQRTVVSQLYCPISSDLLRPVMRKLRTMLQEQMITHGVKLNMKICESAQDFEKDMPLIVTCLHSSRLGTDVSYATKGIATGPNVAVLILHHADSHALPFQRSSKILTAPEYKQIDTMVDMGFLSPTGIYDCDMNKNAIKDLTSFLLKQ